MEGPNAEGAAPEPTLAAALTLVARPGYHLPCLQCGTRNARYEELPTQCPHFSKAKGLFAERAVHERSAKLNALLRASYFIIGIRAAAWPPDRWPDSTPKASTRSSSATASTRVSPSSRSAGRARTHGSHAPHV